MLLLTRDEIASLLTPADYIRVVEDAFRCHAEGAARAAAPLHLEAMDGEFHIKAGILRAAVPYFGAKVNGGFFHNARFALPSIQGLILLSRADNGVPLAVMDSAEITRQRTGAATAVAAKYLARPDSKSCLICGCGNQGRAQIAALCQVLPIERALAWSPDAEEAASYASAMAESLSIDVRPAGGLDEAVQQSDVCITCTPSRIPFIRREWVPKGMFIAAVGADSPEKQELAADLVAQCKVVADLKEQSIKVGETHHAIKLGWMEPAQVHAELGEIVAGKRPGRENADEIIVFDSTGTALQDVAAAAAVYERALARRAGQEWRPC